MNSLKPPIKPCPAAPSPHDDEDEDELESSSILTLSPPPHVIDPNVVDPSPPSKSVPPPLTSHIHQSPSPPTGRDISPTSPLSSSSYSNPSANSITKPSELQQQQQPKYLAKASTTRKRSFNEIPSHPLLDSKYNLGRKLGRGCFATVYKATRLSDNTLVAIKSIERNRLDEETSTLLDNELQILRTVSEHPGIVTLRDHVDTDSHMFFVMDYVDGGPLLDRIVSRGSFSENDARILLRCILLTLQYLSKLGCVHRDIKPENILVDNHSHTWPVKLTDFGLSTKMQPDQLLYAALGTPLFVAPEILSGQGYDCSCDMWSLGVVMYIVLCGYPPFPFNDTPQSLIDAIIHGRYDFPKKEWDHVSNDAKDMIKRMLEIDPSKRITPEQALQHRWVARTQSTNDLPNRKLSSFNAKRKLKALVVAVRTMNIVSRPTHISKGEKEQQQLLKDVEHSRALIERMGIGLDGKSLSSIKDRDGQSFDGELLSSRGSRRSLVLPVNALAGDVPHEQLKSTAGGFWNDPVFGSKVVEIDANASQYMQSRAKALMAEVHRSGLLDDETNPFMVTVKEQRESMKTNIVEKKGNIRNDGGPPALASLDLGLLGGLGF